MKYKIIAMPFHYYSGIAVRLAATVFLVLMLCKSLAVDEMALTIFLAAFSGGMFYWAFFWMKNFIYAKIDLTRLVVIYGNLFFNTELRLNEVEHLGHYLYFKCILKVKMSGKMYYMLCHENDVEKYFQAAAKD
jgi:hypothetical protein